MRFKERKVGVSTHRSISQCFYLKKLKALVPLLSPVQFILLNCIKFDWLGACWIQLNHNMFHVPNQSNFMFKINCFFVKILCKFLEKFDPKNMQKTCFMFNKIEELLLFLLVLFYLKGLKNDKFGFANLYFNQFNSRNSDSTMFSLFIVSICPICISVLRQQDVTSAKIDSKSTSYMGSDRQHAPP